MEFYKRGNGMSLPAIGLIPNIEKKVVESKWKLSLRNFWGIDKDVNFTHEDISIIAKVCNDDFEVCGSVGKISTHFCHNCITESLSSSACLECQSMNPYGNLPKKYIEATSPILEDIKKLRRFVEKENSAHFI